MKRTPSKVEWSVASPLSVPLEDISRSAIPKDIRPIIDRGAEWHYLAGKHPNAQWTRAEFNTAGWKSSAAAFGYNHNDNKTLLKDMEGRYTVVYLRKAFDIAKLDDIGELGLAVKYDDGFIAYLNGREIIRAGVFGGSGARVSDVEEHERKGWEYFRIDNHGSL